jgi:Na+-driven multidrug efflux pump
MGVPMVYVGTLIGGIQGAALAHLLASAMMAALFLVYVHNRTVPISLQDTFKYAWLPSFSSGFAALLIALPLRWMMNDGLVSLIIQVTGATLVLCLFGFIFLSNDSERMLVVSAVRRLIPRTN